MMAKMGKSFPSGSVVRICLPVQEMWVKFLIQEDPQEEKMATHSSILALKIPWTEEPGGLQSMGLHRVRENLATEHTKMRKSVSRFSEK